VESFARLVILRFGVALAPDGGALKKMLLPFKLGLGGPLRKRRAVDVVDRTR
jgi:NAD dependent epimerase/dehydratase family enzyme